jgi:hypothetical protein
MQVTLTFHLWFELKKSELKLAGVISHDNAVSPKIIIRSEPEKSSVQNSSLQSRCGYCITALINFWVSSPFSWKLLFPGIEKKVKATFGDSR